MNSKSVYKYQLNDFKKSIMIFYLVIACIFVLIFLSTGTKLLTINSLKIGPGSVSGLELASFIFLFVGGLNMFREAFRFSMQNGVSRKSIWTGTVLTFLTVGGVMALIDTVIRMALLNLSVPWSNVKMQGFYDLMYPQRSLNNGMIQNALEGFLLNFCMYAAALAVGYFITVGYYHMNKIAKIIVSIGVPAFIMILLPILIGIFSKSDPSYEYYHATRVALGGSNYDNPYFAMGSGLLISAVFLGLTYLMVRRAPIKD